MSPAVSIYLSIGMVLWLATSGTFERAYMDEKHPNKMSAAIFATVVSVVSWPIFCAWVAAKTIRSMRGDA